MKTVEIIIKISYKHNTESDDVYLNKGSSLFQFHWLQKFSYHSYYFYVDADR